MGLRSAQGALNKPPIAEVPTAKYGDILEGSFTRGYHAWKHGITDDIATGNMGKVLFGDESRYVINNPSPGAWSVTPKGLIYNNDLVNTTLYTKDAANFFNMFKNVESSTVWKGQYVHGGIVDAGQVNVDFVTKGFTWRVAVDEITGQVVNFFKVTLGPSTMKYTNIRIVQQGTATNPLVDNLFQQ